MIEASKHNRRLEDRTDDDWSREDVIDGILNRIKFAAPTETDDEPLRFREGTQEIPVNLVRGWTMADILRALKDLGILSELDESADDNAVSKLVETRDSTIGDEHFDSILKMAKHQLHEEDKARDLALDFSKSEDIRYFVGECLKQMNRKGSLVEMCHPDLSDGIAELVNTLEPHVRELVSRNNQHDKDGIERAYKAIQSKIKGFLSIALPGKEDAVSKNWAINIYLSLSGVLKDQSKIRDASEKAE